MPSLHKPAEETPSQLGRFRVRSTLGRGGMGVVYEAYDPEREILVALKTIPRVDADALIALKREFREFQHLSHRGLVQLHELHADGEQVFFSMELLPGVDFLDWVRPVAPSGFNGDSPTLATRSQFRVEPFLEMPHDAPLPAIRVAFGTLDVRRVYDALGQLVDALTFLHDAGKLHRDIKSSNVLVMPGGGVKLLDFGVSTDAVGSSFAGMHRGFAGTPLYMAPEALERGESSAAVDLYAVGVLLYQALTGVDPFPAALPEVLFAKHRKNVVPPQELWLDCPADLAALCMGLLAYDPAQRWDGAAVQAVLQQHNRPLELTPQPARVRMGGVPFVGRVHELAELERAFAEMRSEREFRAVYLHGETGIGKSCLVDQFLMRTVERDAGTLVFPGRCLEQDAVPFKAIDLIMDQLSELISRLPRSLVEELVTAEMGVLAQTFPAFRAADPRLLAWEEAGPVDPQERRRALFHCVRTLFQRLAERFPVVVAIDDLHWGDVDSGALLAELFRDPGAPSMLFVGSLRDDQRMRTDPLQLKHEVQASLPPVAATLPTKGVHLHLTNLDATDGERLARAVLGAAAEHDVAARVAAEAQGHPLLMIELARAMENGAEGPTTLGELVQARLASLDPEALQILEVLATATKPLSPRVVLKASALPPQRFELLLRGLRADFLVRASTRGRRRAAVELYQGRMKGMVLLGVDERRQVELHRRLALAYEELAADESDALAIHYRDAGMPQAAAVAAERAGDVTRVAFAFERAAAFYQLACAMSTEPSAALYAKVGEMHAFSGRGEAAAQAFAEASRRSEGREAVDLMRRSAENLLRSGRIDEGLRSMREVLRMVGVSPPTTATRSVANFLYRRMRVKLRGLSYQLRERRLPEEKEAELRAEVLYSAGSSLATVEELQGFGLLGQFTLIALDSGRADLVHRALVSEAAALAAQGGKSEAKARAVLDAAAQVLATLDDPFARGLHAYLSAVVTFMSTRFDEANQHAREGYLLLRNECRGAHWEMASVAQLQLWTCAFVGNLRGLRELALELSAEANERGDIYLALQTRTGYSNLAWLMDDTSDRARRLSADAIARWTRDGFHQQHFSHIVAEVNTRLYRREATAAAAVIDGARAGLKSPIIGAVQLNRIILADLEARVALAGLADGDASAAVTTRLDRALGALDREDREYARVLALLARGGRAMLQADRPTAGRAFERARKVARQAGLGLYDDVAVACLRALGAPDADELHDVESQWRAQGVRRPDAFLRIFAPYVAMELAKTADRLPSERRMSSAVAN